MPLQMYEKKIKLYSFHKKFWNYFHFASIYFIFVSGVPNLII